ncbi:MAG TPA: zf-HC2 domain-containing protein, partial [Microlunatus sp.]
MTEPDPFADWDAAYVLGALSVPERHAFEDHLAGCDECRTAVNELAAMPGLLSQLPAAEAVALNDERRLDDHDQQAGDRGLPESIRRMAPPRTRSSHGRLLLVAVLVLALLIGGVAGYLVRGAVTGPPNPAPTASAPNNVRLAFAPVRPSTMIAVADLTGTGTGTKI